MSPHKVAASAGAYEDPSAAVSRSGYDDVEQLAAEQRRQSISTGMTDPDMHDLDHPVRQWVMGRTAFMHRMPHHGGAGALWHEKWEQLAARGIHPFQDGVYEDFAPTFEALESHHVNPSDAQFTETWIAVGDALNARAEDHSRRARSTLASPLYLRAAAAYRIARQPYVATVYHDDVIASRTEAWTKQKCAYLNAGSALGIPLREIQVPFQNKPENEAPEAPIYLRFPNSATSEAPCPVVILLSGLDMYRTDHNGRSNELLSRGWAVAAVDMPGTGDCPADPTDPTSTDRLLRGVLEYLREEGRFDMKGIMVWGCGLGGYYAVRAAHTLRGLLLGAVAHGAGCHNFLDPEWLEQADGHEFPFGYLPALASAFGYRSIARFKAEAQQKHSLLTNRILDGECSPLLFVNGLQDGLMPIEDSMMIVDRGIPREGIFSTNAPHMGPSNADRSIYPWMEKIMSGRGLGAEEQRAQTEARVRADSNPDPVVTLQRRLTVVKLQAV